MSAEIALLLMLIITGLPMLALGVMYLTKYIMDVADYITGRSKEED